MAISGIEAQLMITRTADYTRDTSVMHRKNELMNDYLTLQQKAAEVQEKQTVIKTVESDEVRLHPDDSEGGGNSAAERRSGSKKRGAHDDSDTAAPGTVVLSETHLIDIKI